jgi:hypothetical protein
MSERLAAAAKAPVTRRLVEGAHHEDIWDVGGETIQQAVSKWIYSLDGSD